MDSFIQEKKLELKALRAKYRQATQELYDFQNNYTIKLINELKENSLIYITCNHEQIDIVSLGAEGLRKKEDYHCANCHSDLIAMNLSGQKILMTDKEQRVVYDFKNSQKHRAIYESWIPNASPKTVKMLKVRQELYSQYEKVQNEIIQKIVDGMKKTGIISSCEHISQERKCEVCNAHLENIAIGQNNYIYIESWNEEKKFKEIIATIPEMYGHYGYSHIDSRFDGDEQ